jgi:DNA adenine methylase
VNAPTRPALRYYGGKWRIAPWIIKHFPEHTCYVEPYSGSASVLLRKPPSPFEVLNDRDEDVITFFRMLRERPEDLLRLLEFTPWARAELYACYLPTDDPLERARRYYVRSMQGWFGGTRKEWQGWRFQKQQVGGRSTIASWGSFEHIRDAALRLRDAQIDCDDALAVIPRFDTPQTLFYVDPPHPRTTRSARWGNDGYRFEMTDHDHRALAELLAGVQGMVVVSSYPSPLYEELYAGWARVERTAMTGGKVKTFAREVLWLSPRTAAAAAQLHLFGEAAS